MLFPTSIAGSLPKPEWLAEPNVLWAPWKSQGAELARAKRDALILRRSGIALAGIEGDVRGRRRLEIRSDRAGGDGEGGEKRKRNTHQSSTAWPPPAGRVFLIRNRKGMVAKVRTIMSWKSSI